MKSKGMKTEYAEHGKTKVESRYKRTFLVERSQQQRLVGLRLLC